MEPLQQNLIDELNKNNNLNTDNTSSNSSSVVKESLQSHGKSSVILDPNLISSLLLNFI